MIGLKRNTVEVIPYQEEWVDIYKETETELYGLLKGEIQSIEHIGSTAIKEMASKPIIDMAVAIESYDKLDKIRQVLNQNNCEDRGEKNGGYLFVKREKGLTTHHIHFVLRLGKRWSDYISFKNKLNADEKIRKQYSKLKQELAGKFTNNRGRYTESKSEFINKVLILIEKERNIAANEASVFTTC